MSKISFDNVDEGTEVEVLVQISPRETFPYTGIVSRVSDTELSMWTTDSPNDTYETEREIDIPIAKILELDIFE
jgi:hypothetical protein